MTKVIRPTPQPAVDGADQTRDRHTTATAARQLSNFVARIRQRFLRREHIQITMSATFEIPIVSERESQEVHTGPRFTQRDHFGLLAIDRQPEAAFELIFHPADETLPLELVKKLIPRLETVMSIGTGNVD